VADALDVALHDPDVVVDQVNPLPELRYRHVPRVVVVHRVVLLYLGFAFVRLHFAAVAGFRLLAFASGAAAVAPNIVAFQVVRTHVGIMMLLYRMKPVQEPIRHA